MQTGYGRILALGVVVSLAGLLSACNPPSEPSCGSGTGTLTFVNTATESVTISVSDDAGPLTQGLVVGANGGRRAELYPVGPVHVAAVGSLSGAALLIGNYQVSCDGNTVVTVQPSAQVNLDVNLSGDGQGLVSSNPDGISCGSVCVAGFAPGTSVTLTATPSLGSAFAGWSGACSGTGTTCIVDMSQAQSVSAQFSSLNPLGGYPASHPALAQVISGGGPVLPHPSFTAITFAGDPNVAALNDFTSKVGSSSFWSAAGADYGVGSASATAPVMLAQSAPSSIDDSAIQTWLKGKLDAADPAFPAPTSGSLYILYYPSTTHVTLQGLSSCVDFDGYHWQLTLGNGQNISYAVVMECTTTLGDTTSTASHEMIEAATDPLPGLNAAFGFVAQSQEAWETMSFGAEVGDMCQFYSESYYTPSDLGYEVQRSWSNTQAAASLDPCVPNSDTYFNSAAVVNDTIVYSDSGSTYTTKGVYVPVGGSATIEVDLFSSGATAAWQLDAEEQTSAGTHLSFSWDRTSGQNGDVAHVTVHVLSSDTSRNAEFFWIKSTLGGVSHYWPVAVGQVQGAATTQAAPRATARRPYSRTRHAPLAAAN